MFFMTCSSRRAVVQVNDGRPVPSVFVCMCEQEVSVPFSGPFEGSPATVMTLVCLCVPESMNKASVFCVKVHLQSVWLR